MLDFYARKQTHVVRSTFAVELTAMIDAMQVGSLINLVLPESYAETGVTITNLAKAQETGKLLLPLEVCVDTKSVYDALASDPIRRKGSIDREEVMQPSSTGTWEVIGLPPVRFGSSRE